MLNIGILIEGLYGTSKVIACMSVCLYEKILRAILLTSSLGFLERVLICIMVEGFALADLISSHENEIFGFQIISFS